MGTLFAPGPCDAEAASAESAELLLVPPCATPPAPRGGVPRSAIPTPPSCFSALLEPKESASDPSRGEESSPPLDLAGLFGG